MITLTGRQARQFMLIKQGLLGEYKFIGKQGALDYIRQAGCIQFDPVDVCGKNSEITLQSRVGGFTKEMLAELLYTDRKLFDYPDKQLAIIPTEYWAYFERFRKAARDNLKQHPEVKKHIEKIRKFIDKNGAVNSDDFKLEGDSSWRSAINWSSGSKLSRSVLEQMYSSGDLIVHHKKGTRRYYDLAAKHIPPEILNVSDPLSDDFAHLKWRVMRRIGAVGFMWNRPSDAWLHIWGLSNDVRKEIFDALIDKKEITEFTIEGLKTKFYFLTSDMPLVKEVLTNPNPRPRCELIAPLDPFMWDRKLIRAIFGFEYSWEIYTPPQKRKYGAYVLPLIYGEQFIGRVEAVCDRKTKTLIVKNIWYEKGVKQTKIQEKAVSACIKKFMLFNGCKLVSISKERKL